MGNQQSLLSRLYSTLGSFLKIQFKKKKDDSGKEIFQLSLLTCGGDIVKTFSQEKEGSRKRMKEKLALEALNSNPG